jgi:hypothetical protein
MSICFLADFVGTDCTVLQAGRTIDGVFSVDRFDSLEDDDHFFSRFARTVQHVFSGRGICASRGNLTGSAATLSSNSSIRLWQGRQGKKKAKALLL